MKCIFAFLLVSFFHIGLLGQTMGYSSAQGIRIAYMGSIIYPGFTLGTEIPRMTKPQLKAGKSGTITHFREQYHTFNLGMYHHPTFHTLVYTQYELIFRRQRSSGFYYDAGPGIGLSRTFIAGPVYRVNEEGQVIRKNLAGHFYGMASVSGSLGFNFQKNTDIPLKLFIKSSILLMGPYNRFVYFRPTMEAGLIYHLKNGRRIAA